jgi:predicted DNA-binding transcriptional regulator AlpA
MRNLDHFALQHFDELPDSAHVRLPVVCALFSVSRATVWRWSTDERLPRPIRIGRAVFWKVGELRGCLQAGHLSADALADVRSEGEQSDPGSSPRS